MGTNVYAYCENNPINRLDSNGKFWKEIGNFFKNIGNIITRLFGASTQVSAVKEEVYSKTPIISPISVTTGSTISTVTSGKNNSSKPISVYANGVSNAPTSSNVGIKVNIAKATMDFSIGLNNTGLKFSLIHEDLTSSASVRLDITKLQIGFEVEIEKQINGDISESAYANASINGAFWGAAYMIFQTGTWNSSLQPAY